MKYQATIGMEVHAELCTGSKMFCPCSADFFGREPNTQVCPVCMGYPGVLPVINKQAIEYTVRVGLALHCQIARFSKFDRKNYNYPDLPKGYQISQYDLPLCADGWLDIEVDGQTRHIGVQRAHLEEDTAKTFHVGDASLVDYNRSGVPLLEIVTQPDIRTAEEARQFLIKLRTILRYLGVSTADMEKGAMRCEANVSIAPTDSSTPGVKIEIKNLNSFRSVKLAIEYEIARQTEVLESGGEVRQVTMGWNERENHTVFQRSKEGAADYRYFPEPDLPPLELSDAYVDAIRDSLPELPDAKRDRLIHAYGIKRQDAEVLIQDVELADYYETCAQINPALAQTACNWVIGEFLYHLNDRGIAISEAPVSPPALIELLEQIEQKTINNTTAKAVLADMFETGWSATDIIAEKGLTQIRDTEQLEQLATQAIQDNPQAVAQYLDGKETVIGFLIGQVMRTSRGKANPQLVQKMLRQKLNALKPD